MVQLAEKTESAEALRVACYLDYVCQKAGIKPNGFQMECYFEPDKIVRDSSSRAVMRTCKYDRYFSNKSSPGPSTIEQIENKISGSAELYYNPVWDVLNTLMDASKLSALIETLHLCVQEKLLLKKRNIQNKVERKTVTPHDLFSIMKSGDLHALSALLILQFTEPKYVNVQRNVLERCALEMLLNLGATKYPSSVCWRIYSYFSLHLSSLNRKIELNQHRFTAKVNARKKLVTRAMITDFIMFGDERIQLLNLAFWGNRPLITQELLTPKIRLNQNRKHEKNLFWLLGKLQNMRSYSDRNRFTYRILS